MASLTRRAAEQPPAQVRDSLGCRDSRHP